ncbi:MAG: hypothetical protein ACUVTL_11060 [Thermoproteota archaeon]
MTNRASTKAYPGRKITNKEPKIHLGTIQGKSEGKMWIETQVSAATIRTSQKFRLLSRSAR